MVRIMPTSAQPLWRCLHPSPLGDLLLLANASHVLGVWFADQSAIPRWALEAPLVSQTPPPASAAALLQRLGQQLDEYFAGQRQRFDLPLDWSHGSAFQQAVWAALARLEPGLRCSYGALAAAIGRPAAARAVGGALGRNPLGIVLPCHRVLGHAGRLTGYTGGLERKQQLLALEARWPAAQPA
jgi:methylated-DNA-[protein]-cysteine S-methyltransferase